MNLSHTVIQQIHTLIQSLSPSNAQVITTELTNLRYTYGADCTVHIIRHSIDGIHDIMHANETDRIKFEIVANELYTAVQSVDCIHTINKALDGLSHRSDLQHTNTIDALLTQLHLPPAVQLTVALVVASRSLDTQLQQHAHSLLISQLSNLSQFLSTPYNTNQYDGRLHDWALKQLLMYVQSNTQIDNNLKQSILNQIHTSLPASHRIQLDDTKPSSAPAVPNRAVQLLSEVGYHACTVESLRDILSQLHHPISSSETAQLVAFIIRTHPHTGDEAFKYQSNIESTEHTGWDLNALLQSLSENNNRLNWFEVFSQLDQSEFAVADRQSVSMLIEIWRRVSNDQPYPLDTLFCHWQHSDAHAQLLNALIPSAVTLFSITDSTRAAQTEDGAAASNRHAPTAIASIPENTTGDSGVVLQTWSNIELLDMLLDLGMDHQYMEIKALLQQAVRHTPDLVLTGLLHIQQQNSNGIQQHEPNIFAVLPMHMSVTPVHAVLNSFPQYWYSNKSIMTHWLIKSYMHNRAFVQRVHEVVREYRDMLITVLEARPVAYSFELSTLSDKRDLIKLDTWLTAKLDDSFVEPLLQYIQSNVELDQAIDRVNGSVTSKAPHVPIEAIAIMFRVLLANKAQFSNESTSLIHELYTASAALEPALHSLTSTGSVDEIEDEANSYFQKIYTSSMSLDDVVDTLHQFKSSDNKRDRELYACMIHNLFDEYRFFHKYPMRELHITGFLFGMLIQHQLVQSYTLTIALKFVLEALRKDSKMFQFGIWAVEQFKGRLHQWPAYCVQLTQIPHLAAAAPELSEYINSIIQQNAGSNYSAQQQQGNNLLSPISSAMTPSTAQSPESLTSTIHSTQSPSPAPASGVILSQQTHIPASSPFAEQRRVHNNDGSTTVLNDANTRNPMSVPPGLSVNSAVSSPTLSATTSTTDTKSNFGTAVSNHSLVAAHNNAQSIDNVEPNDSVKDKIHFLVNNVSKTNLKQKSKELKVLLQPVHYHYFAQYFVIKRVSLEANFQKLYAQFIDTLAIKDIDRHIILTTYDNIRVLLHSEKILTSTSERTLLRNLGSWLGLITLARNKPIRAKYLDLKELILDAYDTGRLIAIVPFCAKVLEGSIDSKVFKLPNPYFTMLVALLKEIFDLPSLKLNLRFEIEVLFNNLQLNIKDVKTTTLLNNRLAVRDAAQTPVSTPSNAQQQLKTAGAQLGRMRSPSPSHMLSDDDNNSVGTAATNNTGMTSPSLVAMNNQQYSTALTSLAVSYTNTAGSEQRPDVVLNSLSQYVTVSNNVPLFNMYVHLKRLVPTAIDRAIREIISPVVERSVTIACVTTRELIIKDYACEPDEGKMRLAAHQMVQSLTSSLALVTCKEPLRVSINNHLGSLLEANTQAGDRQLIESTCIQVSTDNLELGCTLIERAASERAVREIDDALTAVYQQRRKHREISREPFYDASVYNNASKYPQSLPDPLKPKLGGLSSSQLRVYEDFTRIRQLYAAVASAATTSTLQSKDGAPTDVKRSASPSSFNATTPTNAAQQSFANAQQQQQQQVAANIRSQQVRSPTLSSGSQSMPPQQQQQQQQPQQQNNLTSPLQVALDKLIGVIASLEQAVLRFPNHKSMPLHSLTMVQPGSSTQPNEHEINVLLRMLQSLLSQVPRDDTNVPRDFLLLTFAHKVFKRLYERDNRTSLLQIDVHIAVLKCIRSACSKVVQELTGWLIYGEDDRKYILPITAGLLRARLLVVSDVDHFLSKLANNVIASGNAVQTQNNIQVIHPHLEYILALIRRVVVKRPILQVSELSNTIDTLKNIVQNARYKMLIEPINYLLNDIRTSILQIENYKNREGIKAMIHTEFCISKTDKNDVQLNNYALYKHMHGGDTADLVDGEIAEFNEKKQSTTYWYDKSTYLFNEWLNICYQGNASDKSYALFLNQLEKETVLLNYANTKLFFLYIIELAVQKYADSKNYNSIDCLAKLFVFLLKFHEPNTTTQVNQIHSKIYLLYQFLLSITIVCRQSQSQPTFNPKPYLRLFTNIIHDLNTPDPILDSSNLDVLSIFSLIFYYLRPQKCVKFVYAWIELIFHRMYFSKLLLNKHNTALAPPADVGDAVAQHSVSKLIDKPNILFVNLLVHLLQFIHPFLAQNLLNSAIKLIYKSVLRILLILLHDFPDVLIEYHSVLLEYIPDNCIQIKNIILSSFPKQMKLIDPFTKNLKVDLLPDILVQPHSSVQYVGTMLDNQVFNNNVLMPLKSYLYDQFNDNTEQMTAILSQNYTLNNDGVSYEDSSELNNLLINSSLYYICTTAVQQLQTNQYNTIFDIQSFVQHKTTKLLLALMQSNSAELTYVAVNHIVNNLRYPNIQTYYYSLLLLHVYEYNLHASNTVCEQITKILLERLIVDRPHPWGLLVSFIELINNSHKYQFWSQKFIDKNAEIKNLFTNLSQNCLKQ